MTHHSSVVVELVDALAQPVDGRYGASPHSSVSDVVKVNGTAASISYKVRLYRAEDGILIAQTWSTPGTGAYSFDNLEVGVQYVAVVMDHTGTYRPAAAGLLTPGVST